MSAGHNVHITGSDVMSQTATNIVGQNVTIDAALGSTDTTQTQETHSTGTSMGLGGAWLRWRITFTAPRKVPATAAT